MKHFGTVAPFDETKGRGRIKPEGGGKDIEFERSAISWERQTQPTVGQRLSYDISAKDGESKVVNLQNA